MPVKCCCPNLGTPFTGEIETGESLICDILIGEPIVPAFEVTLAGISLESCDASCDIDDPNQTHLLLPILNNCRYDAGRFGIFCTDTNYTWGLTYGLAIERLPAISAPDERVTFSLNYDCVPANIGTARFAVARWGTGPGKINYNRPFVLDLKFQSGAVTGLPEQITAVPILDLEDEE